ncbi:MAG: alpha-galactosidase, partial [Armatimonadetes bacterium]|nr:alpha-galactosidase [Armatimonadota bacterium]
MSAPDSIAPTPSEMASAQTLAQALHARGLGRMLGEADGGLLPPFSFRYGGQPSDEFLLSWPCVETRSADGLRSERAWQDERTGLQVRLEARSYADFPAVEWTVWLSAEHTRDTDAIADFQGGDLLLPASPGDGLAIHSVTGDYYSAHGYEPYVLNLPPGCDEHIAPDGGRGSNRAFPYFNLVHPGGGLCLAVGWPGQWEAAFTRSAGGNLRVAAGQQQVDLVLHPGETIRSPLIALLFWEGDDLDRAQNLWRRWMLAHNVPRMAEGPNTGSRAAGIRPQGRMAADGAAIRPLLFGGSNVQLVEMTQATEENQKWFISRYLDAGVPLDYWWMDAGWYPCGGEWPRTGTWEPDPERFPGGLRAVSDFAHERGLKTLLWFEPERVADGTWLQTQHPEWLINQPGVPTDQPQNRLLDLGNP